jgi:DNA relaxase NicK
MIKLIVRINSCFEQFLDCHPQKNLIIEKIKKVGLIFKIGNRRSSKYYRLYTKDNGLRFEF